MNKKLITISLLLSSLISCSGDKAPTSPPAPKPNMAPQITSFSPSLGLTVFPGQLIDFAVTAADVDNDALAYQYALDDSTVATTQTYQLNANLLLDGTHALTVEVSDPDGAKATKSWQIEKQDGTPVWSQLNEIVIPEDMPEIKDSILVDLNQKLNGQSAPEEMIKEITSQSNAQLVNVFVDSAGFLRVDSLQSNGFGESVVRLRATDSANGKSRDKELRIIISRQPDIGGIVKTFDTGNPIADMIIEANGTIIDTTGNDGRYQFQWTPGSLRVRGKRNANWVGVYLDNITVDSEDNPNLDLMTFSTDAPYKILRNSNRWIPVGSRDPDRDAVYPIVNTSQENYHKTFMFVNVPSQFWEDYFINLFQEQYPKLNEEGSMTYSGISIQDSVATTLEEITAKYRLDPRAFVKAAFADIGPLGLNDSQVNIEDGLLTGAKITYDLTLYNSNCETPRRRVVAMAELEEGSEGSRDLLEENPNNEAFQEGWLGQKTTFPQSGNLPTEWNQPESDIIIYQGRRIPIVVLRSDIHRALWAAYRFNSNPNQGLGLFYGADKEILVTRPIELLKVSLKSQLAR